MLKGWQYSAKFSDNDCLRNRKEMFEKHIVYPVFFQFSTVISMKTSQVMYLILLN